MKVDLKDLSHGYKSPRGKGQRETKDSLQSGAQQVIRQQIVQGGPP